MNKRTYQKVVGDLTKVVKSERVSFVDLARETPVFVTVEPRDVETNAKVTQLLKDFGKEKGVKIVVEFEGGGIIIKAN